MPREKRVIFIHLGFQHGCRDLHIGRISKRASVKGKKEEKNIEKALSFRPVFCEWILIYNLRFLFPFLGTFLPR